jgi:hypothetical protein
MKRYAVGWVAGQELELGAFEATGLDLRPVMFLARFPTLIIFAQGLGIAVARAIVRLYYTASKPSMLAYQVLALLFTSTVMDYYSLLSSEEVTIHELSCNITSDHVWRMHHFSLVFIGLLVFCSQILQTGKQRR